MPSQSRASHVGITNWSRSASQVPSTVGTCQDEPRRRAERAEKMIPRTIVFGMSCLFLLAPSALYGAEGTLVSAEQSVCPVMEGTPIDRSLYVDYRGKRVYLCCRFCLETFKKNPEPYLSKLPQFKVLAAEAAASATTIDSEHEPQAQQDHAHEHAIGDQAPHGVTRLIRFVGKFHSAAVHFPIALVIAAALSEVLAYLTKKQFLRDAARFNLIVAALSGVVAVLAGLAAEYSSSYPDELARVLVIHKWLGISMVLLIVISAALCEVSHRSANNAFRFVYRIALAFSVVLVSLAGLFGGYLVYGLGHYSW